MQQLTLEDIESTGSERTVEQKLLGDLLDLATELDSTPTSRDMADLGPHSPSKYHRTFGCWNNAVRAAGLEPNSTHQVGALKNLTREEKLDAIRELAERLGRPPTGYEMNKKGEVSRSTIKQTFGSWNDGVREAGYEPEVGPIWDRCGEKNHNYIEDANHPYRCGEGWTQGRRETLERDDYTCRACGMTDEEHREIYDRGLDVHHVVPLRKFETKRKANDPENLVTACVPCHKRYEGYPVFPSR